MSLETLLQIQTTLFDRLMQVCTRHKHQFLKNLLNDVLADSDRVFFLHQGKPMLGIYLMEAGAVRITDEIEHIELLLAKEDVERLHNLLKDKKTFLSASSQDTLYQDLLHQYQQKKLTTFLEKPFLVYDIETTYDERTSQQVFAIAYAIDSREDHTNGLAYQYVDRDGLTAFARFLVDYPGWVVGFNHISFDNPITLDQGGCGPEDIAVLQAKSLDPFQLVRGMTGRRMSLQSLATTLLGSGKTLSSGVEGQDYLEARFRDGNKEALEKVKNYCKNDVEITLGVFLYMIAYHNLNLDGKHIVVDETTFLQYGTKITDTSESAPDNSGSSEATSLFA